METILSNAGQLYIYKTFFTYMCYVLLYSRNLSSWLNLTCLSTLFAWCWDMKISSEKKITDKPALSIIPSSFSDVLFFKPADGNTNALGWQIYTFSPWANQDTRVTLFRLFILKKYFERDIEQMDHFLYPPISTYVPHFSPNIRVRDSLGKAKIQTGGKQELTNSWGHQAYWII